MGVIIMNCLFERIRGDDAAIPERRTLLVPELAVRELTGPAPGSAASEPWLAANTD